ncbi:MAPEG family protein [Parahaliea sp. F7430]|uniref:MAPEG family protein n=1 Tax=Sediminihaliea albiluteola TaxID=2758564 RepID=A0A7W2YJX9_9GAMM|nr:MAPEG family protein [Sediminihaliea albiluteola]MBA6412758.1 MAPEG family protein [Sediminihaliea albiluteola]
MTFSAQGLALPLLAMMLLTFLVWLVMFVRRIAYMSSSNVDSEQLLTPADVERILPAQIQAPANNLRNLVELPVIFYTISIYLMMFAQVDGFYVGCAWVFVVFRYLHSFVHCTYNRVMHRFLVYLIASLALWVMVLRAVFYALF